MELWNTALLIKLKAHEKPYLAYKTFNDDTPHQRKLEEIKEWQGHAPEDIEYFIENIEDMPLSAIIDILEAQFDTHDRETMIGLPQELAKQLLTQFPEPEVRKILMTLGDSLIKTVRN